MWIFGNFGYVSDHRIFIFSIIGDKMARVADNHGWGIPKSIMEARSDNFTENIAEPILSLPVDTGH